MKIQYPCTILIKDSNTILGDEDGDKDDDDQDVVFIDTSGTSVEPTPNLNLRRTKDPLRESHDDEGDVVYISSTGGSRTDQTDPEAEDDSETDDNANPRVINPVQLHMSYQDSQDVEIYQIEEKRVRDQLQLHLSYEDSQDVEIYHIEDNRVRDQPYLTSAYFWTFLDPHTMSA